MSDLISRSDLIKTLKDECKRQLMGSENRTFVTYGDVIDMVYEQPIAYDAEKVVEQLKEKSFERYGNEGMGGQMVVDFDDIVAVVNKEWGEENGGTAGKRINSGN